LKKGSILEVSSLIENDLEPVVFRLTPRLKVLKKRIMSLDLNGVMLSGSGPSVFGITTTKQEAEAVGSALSNRYSRVYVVHTL
jgi:4-diphosphocytidyl-2-C-methyl-D-erythritol kinase